MAGYQFFHVEAYAREESTKQRTQTKKNANGTFSSKEVAKEKRGNISWVIAEAMREQDSCYHIENPQPPIFLLGNLEQVEVEANEWAEQATDAKGRKLRKDAPCLLAGVISLPRSEEKNWPKFKEASINWLKEKYGDNLRCVIEHQDEAHPHIHFYAVAKNGQNFDDLHEGKKAQKQLKKQNPQATKQEQNIAFAEAMRATQDNFSQRVGQPFGLTRLGPGRRRLTRKAWQAEQAQAKALAEVERTAKRRHEHYKKIGLEAGKQQAQEEAQAEAKKIGVKVGAVFDGVKTKWHAPSAKVLAETEKLTEQAKSYADKVKQQAEREVQDERNRRRMLDRELEKKTNIASNLDTENKRLKTQLADTEADRQRLLKQLKSSGGGTGGAKPK